MIVGITPAGTLTLDAAYDTATHHKRLALRVTPRSDEAHVHVEMLHRRLGAAGTRPAGTTRTAEARLSPPQARALAFALAPEVADLLRVIAEGQATPDTRRLAVRMLADHVRVTGVPA